MIRMKMGVYGLYEGGKVVGMDKNSGPFEAPADQEKRLVNMGYAEYVNATEKKDEAPQLPEMPDGVDEIPEYNVGMKADELRKIAKLMGLTFAVGTTKAEMVAQMDAFLDEHMEDTEDDADMPPEDIEDAPTFDAAEAVL